MYCPVSNKGMFKVISPSFLYELLSVVSSSVEEWISYIQDRYRISLPPCLSLNRKKEKKKNQMLENFLKQSYVFKSQLDVGNWFILLLNLDAVFYLS